MLKVLLPALMVILLIMLSNNVLGYTVTLNGVCGTDIINSTSRYATFSLSNSGDGPAQQLVIIPNIKGALTPNASVSFAQLLPNATNSTDFYLENFSLPGSYVEYYTVEYQQSGTTFVTVFPCYASFFKRTSSLIASKKVNVTHSGQSYKVDVTFLNLGQYPVDANVSVIAPPTFSISANNAGIYIGAGNSSTYEFSAAPPLGFNATYPVSLALSYTHNDLHYAYFVSATISASNSSTSKPINLVLWLTVAVIAVLVILIGYSLIRGKLSKREK